MIMESCSTRFFSCSSSSSCMATCSSSSCWRTRFSVSDTSFSSVILLLRRSCPTRTENTTISARAVNRDWATLLEIMLSETDWICSPTRLSLIR